MVLHPGENAPVALLNSLIKPAAYAARSSAANARPAVYYPGSAAPLIPVRGGGGGYVVTTVYGGGGATKWNSKGTVLMYHAPLAEELVWAYDAQKVLDLLKEYVASNGEIPAPPLDKIAQQSVVAHEQISFAQSAPPLAATPALETPETLPAPQPDGAAAPADGAAVPAAVPATAAAKPPRSDTEIADWFEAHSVAFHTLFRQRMKIEHRVDAGSVSLSFSVTPNGSAVNCQVSSTSFPDQNFADAVAQLVCRMPFAPRDAAQTDVPPLAIIFTPLSPAATI